MQRAWPYLTTLWKKRPHCQLCSWLLTAQAIFIAHGHFQWTFEQKEGRKRSPFPVATAAQYYSGPQWSAEHISITCPPHSLMEHCVLNFTDKMYKCTVKTIVLRGKPRKFHKPEFSPLRSGREKHYIPHTVNPKGLIFGRKQFKCLHIPNNKTTDWLTLEIVNFQSI